jgi:hypothetical protein
VRRIVTSDAGWVAIVSSEPARLEHHEALDEAGARRRGEERGVGAHRLPDEGAPATRQQLVEDSDDVAQVGLARHIHGTSGALAVPSLVHQDDAV